MSQFSLVNKKGETTDVISAYDYAQAAEKVLNEKGFRLIRHKEVTIGYTEIKHPFAHLTTNDSQAISLFFEHDEDVICSWDDLPFNYPRWSFCVHTREQAIERITEMVNDEGWELIETTEEELKPLVASS